jgi:hypothetical protein
MIFKRKKNRNNDLIWDEKKGEMYLQNKIKKSKPTHKKSISNQNPPMIISNIATGMFLLSAIIFALNYMIKNQ